MAFAPSDSRPAFAVNAATRRYVTPALAASLVLVLALGVFLSVRRAMGALVAPLPIATLLPTALALFSWAVMVRAFGTRLVGPNRRFATWLPTAALLLFAIGCSYPGGRLIDWLVWLPVITGDVWLRWTFSPARHGSPAGSASPVASTQSPPFDDKLLQQLIRTRTAEGAEAIHATLVAEFAAGERSATLYVAFCPPFERLPHVEAEVTDCPDASVKLVQELHHGAQLEVRLSHTSDAAQSVTVELLATTTADG